MGQRLFGGKQVQSRNFTQSVDDLGGGILWLHLTSAVDKVDSICPDFGTQSTGSEAIVVEHVDSEGTIGVDIDINLPGTSSRI